jgi:hypothetical protein
MYKPNGEELMTKHEELRRRAALADRAAEHSHENPSAEALRSAFYAAMFRSPESREDNVEALLVRER